MSGIKETEDVIELATDLAAAIKSAKADGKVNVWDAPKFLALVPDVTAALDGSEKVPLELKNASPDEAKKLAADAVGALKALLDALAGK